MIRDLVERLRALLFRTRQDRELDEELRFHLEREIAANLRRGMSEAQAEREARLALGGIERTKEEVRDARGVKSLHDLAGDIRFALRTLRRNPGFTLAAVVVLGVGIGASTATFAVVDSVLIAELPYPEADRLVRIYPSNAMSWPNLSAVDYQAIAAQQHSFEALGAQAFRGMALSGTGQPQILNANPATSGFFKALQVQPAFGRLVLERDEVVGAPAVTLVSWGLAEQLLGGAPAAVGKSLTLDGTSYQVIGVMPPEVSRIAFMRGQVWPALQIQTPTRRGPFWLRGIARLKPGVTIASATLDLAGISERIFPIWASSFQDSKSRFTPFPLRESVVSRAAKRINLFAGAVGLVLLIAIANVATLVLVRASARDHELAVRVALGASRTRLAQLVLIEGLTLTALAGVVGVVLSVLGLKLLLAMSPTLPRLTEVAFDLRALSFAGVATVIAGVLVSLSPVTTILTGRRTEALRAGATRVTSTRATNVVRRALVIAEFALALPLLLGAGLLLNSFLRLQSVDPGYEPAGVVSAEITLPGSRYPSDTAVRDFWRKALARIAEVPGLVAGGISTSLPPSNPGDQNNFNLVDHPVPEGTSQPVTPWSGVTNGYFAALGIELVDGRLFTPADSNGAPSVLIVSRSWARRFFPNERAVGRQLRSGGCTDCEPTTIVGVVGDVKYQGLANPGEGVYEPLLQTGYNGVNLVVHTRTSSAEALQALRTLLSALDADLPVTEHTLAGELESSLADPKRWTAVIGSFAAVAALLAALGIFGLMSFVVRQRRREIGVRIALGAEPASVTWMIVRQGMRLTLIGAMIGLGLAFVEARWLQALLYDVGAMDPLTLGVVATVLLAVALVACWLPGRSAARIHPVEATAAD